MKKLFIIPLVVIAAHFTVNAQSTLVGFTAGSSFSKYNSKVDGKRNKGNSVAGLTVGVFVDVPISKHFSFQPAVNFMPKGTKDEQTIEGSTEKIELGVNCIEVPLNFLYNFGGSNGNFFIGAGPSLTFSLSGSVLFLDESAGIGYRWEDIKFGTGEQADMKGFDFGINFMTGLCLKNGLLVSLNYNAGLTNLVPVGSDNATVKSHYVGIRLGYVLKGKSKN